MLVDLKDHCSRLVEILGASELAYEWKNVAEWLQLAAAINIEINIIQFDQGFGYCSHADQYSMAREELMRRFVSEFSRFNFVWGSLESCLNNIKPPKHPDKSKQGKISNACYYLQEYFKLKPTLSFLGEEFSAFRLAASSCFGYESVEKRFDLSRGAGCGLFTVYELRNLFAHGSLRFPEPNDENQPISDHQHMVSHATRIVLLSMQMLLLAYFKHSDLEIPYEIPTLWIALSSCHLATQDTDIQMSLF